MSAAPLRTLVVGVNRMGLEHLRAVAQTPEFVVAGICDLNPETARAQAEPRGVPAWTDLADALREDPPDVVMLATPDYVHAAQTVQCAEARVRAVYCEKPMATNLADARRMVAAAEATNCALVINHQRRVGSDLLAARELLSSGELGPLRRIRAYYAGDFLGDGTHALDSLQWLANDPPVEWVEAEMDLFPEDDAHPNGLGMRYGHRTERGFAARFGLAGGVELEVIGGSRSQRRAYQDYLMETAHGALWRVGDIINPRLFVRRDGTPGTHVAVEFDDAVWHAYPRPVRDGETGEWTPVPLSGNCGDHAIANALRLLAGQLAGGNVPHPMDGRIALRNFEALIAGYESARLGRRLTPPVEQPRFPLDLIAEERSSASAPA